MTPTDRIDVVVPPSDLLAAARAAAPAFRSARPFPHAVFDGLFDVEVLTQVVKELPASTQRWRTYDTHHELKRVFDDTQGFGPAARWLAGTLNSGDFVRFIEELTGIGGLVPDPHLRHAGYFDVPTGGFLAPHIDFATHPELSLVRKVNALVYLNAGWQPGWGGQLELWSSHAGGPDVEIVPLMGRLVVFETVDAVHGHPKPVRAPGGRSRLCFSAYYYTIATEAVGPMVKTLPIWGDERTFRTRFRHGVHMLLPPVMPHAARSVIRRVRH